MAAKKGDGEAKARRQRLDHDMYADLVIWVGGNRARLEAGCLAMSEYLHMVLEDLKFPVCEETFLKVCKKHKINLKVKVREPAAPPKKEKSHDPWRDKVSRLEAAVRNLEEAVRVEVGALWDRVGELEGVLASFCEDYGVQVPSLLRPPPDAGRRLSMGMVNGERS